MGRSDQAFTYRTDQNEVEVTVKPFYVPERSLPSRSIFFYAYSIDITNHRNRSIQLLRRQWTIRNGAGEEESVEGDGVVGKNPVIKPGETFQYASFCPLHTETGNMRGRFQMQELNGPMLWVKAPLFFFRPPNDFKKDEEPVRKSV